jgi:hypothetical protein
MEKDLDLDRIRHVAQLAELSLSPEEERRLAGEIGRIVSFYRTRRRHRAGPLRGGLARGRGKARARP